MPSTHLAALSPTSMGCGTRERGTAARVYPHPDRSTGCAPEGPLGAGDESDSRCRDDRERPGGGRLRRRAGWRSEKTAWHCPGCHRTRHDAARYAKLRPAAGVPSARAWFASRADSQSSARRSCHQKGPRPGHKKWRSSATFGHLAHRDKSGVDAVGGNARTPPASGLA